MTATPDTFKPGERWLAGLVNESFNTVFEVQCVQWSPSKTYCLVRFPLAMGKDSLQWRGSLAVGRLLERLPDARTRPYVPADFAGSKDVENESGNNQTGQTGGVESAGGEWPCTCDHCEKVKARWSGKEEWIVTDDCTCEDCKMQREIEAHIKTKA